MSQQDRVHGTAVAVDGTGLLITGASGSGKSALAMQMIAFGAELIGDDQITLIREGENLMASGQVGFDGQIEARGIGVLKVPFAGKVAIKYMVDLDQTELQRLPPERNHEILGISVNLIYGRDAWGLAAALVMLLKGQRLA